MLLKIEHTINPRVDNVEVRPIVYIQALPSELPGSDTKYLLIYSTKLGNCKTILIQQLTLETILKINTVILFDKIKPMKHI